MSNLVLQTVYQLFNADERVVCERVFLPPKQDIAEALARRDPLVTIESRTPVRDFDVFAFSVSFEWDYPIVRAPRVTRRCTTRRWLWRLYLG